ncbi:hypothetical protein B0T17DRAFT_491360, partial [Bombardia bombarda]
MHYLGCLWAWLAAFAVGVLAQETETCSCSGLDYTNGGSYLIDGESEDEFAFTSVFSGCFDSTITPILVSPEGYGYECSAIETQPDDEEQASHCPIPYSKMSSGAWMIVIQAPDYNFAVQRQFNLTTGSTNTVTVTTEYLEPETTTEDCYEDEATVIEYIPGPTTKIVSTSARWSTLGAVTEYYVTIVTEYAYCHWP